MAEKFTDKETSAQPRRYESNITRRQPADTMSHPFGFFRRFANEMDRVFDDFSFGPGWLRPRGGNWMASPWRSSESRGDLWSPEVEVFQRGDQLVVRADLPGLNKDAVNIDITGDTLTIQGDRQQEHHEEREGFFRSERSYGSFFRHIPLPEGAMTEQAKATFRDGVLEITMPSPPEHMTRRRRVEITEGDQPQK